MLGLSLLGNTAVEDLVNDNVIAHLGVWVKSLHVDDSVPVVVAHVTAGEDKDDPSSKKLAATSSK